MSQPAVSALAPLPFELVYDDGKPLETIWHSLQLSLLNDLLHQAMAEQDRSDFVASANVFVYYSFQQAREVWEEGGRLPDVIFEMLSPSTAHKDRTEKKDLYEKVFRTAEYFLYDPDSGQLEGFRLLHGSYRPIRPDRKGLLRSERLGVSVGLWRGVVKKRKDTWVRLFRPDGTLVPTSSEQAREERQRADEERQRADVADQRADAERQRAEAAEAEIARLRALLGGKGQG